MLLSGAASVEAITGDDTTTPPPSDDDDDEPFLPFTGGELFTLLASGFVAAGLGRPDDRTQLREPAPTIHLLRGRHQPSTPAATDFCEFDLARLQAAQAQELLGDYAKAVDFLTPALKIAYKIARPGIKKGPAAGPAKPSRKCLVRVKGVEPSRGCPHMDLNHARLPFRHTRVTCER